MKKILLALLFLFLAMPMAQAELSEEETLTRGRELTEQFCKIEIDKFWQDLAPELQTQLGGQEAFTAYRTNGLAMYGQELKLYDEMVRQEENTTLYIRAASFEKSPDQVWFVVWGFNDDGAVVFFNIVYAGQAPPA